MNFLNDRMLKLATFLFGLLTIGIVVYPFTLKKATSVSCSKNVADRFLGSLANAECLADSSGREWIRSTVRSSKDHKDEWDEFRLNPEAFPNGALVEAFTDSLTPIFYKLGGSAPQTPTDFATTAHGNHIVINASVSYEDLKLGFTLLPYYLDKGSITFRATPAKEIVSKSTPFVTSLESGASRYWYWSLVVSAIALIILASFWYTRTRRFAWGALAVSIGFLLGHLNFETVYRGMGGYLDKDDDTYYIAYVQTHLNDRNIFKCDSDVSFSNRDHVYCRNLPGTGYLLELGILLESMFNDNIGLYGAIGISKLRDMRMTSAFYGFLACILMLLILHQIGARPLNIAMSIGLLWASPLSKFTFERSIFTHTPEMVLLNLTLLFLVLDHLRKIPRWLTLFACGLAMALLVNVRAEYWITLGFLLPLYFLLTRPFTWRIVDWAKFGQLAFYLTFVMPGIAFYVYFARKTNLFYASNTGVILEQMSDLLHRSFYKLFFSNLWSVISSFWDAGLFIFWGAAATVALLAKDFRRNTLAWVALAFVGLYLPALSMYHTPLGMEWQHRYFIKFYPLAFLMIAMTYSTFGTRWKQATWFVALFSFVKEYFADQAHVFDSALKLERAKRILTDTQLSFYGYQEGYFANYALGTSLILLCAAILMLVTAFLFVKKLVKREPSSI